MSLHLLAKLEVRRVLVHAKRAAAGDNEQVPGIRPDDVSQRIQDRAVVPTAGRTRSSSERMNTRRPDAGSPTHGARTSRRQSTLPWPRPERNASTDERTDRIPRALLPRPRRLHGRRGRIPGATPGPPSQLHRVDAEGRPRAPLDLASRPLRRGLGKPDRPPRRRAGPTHRGHAPRSGSRPGHR
jgi:hypothetical protein